MPFCQPASLFLSAWTLLVSCVHGTISGDTSHPQQILFHRPKLHFSLPQASLHPTCPANPPVSCHISHPRDIVDPCCTNLPGGQLLLTQFWDTHPATGPAESWTIHGLWPDNCDGTYEASCDSSRSYHNITQILERGGGQEALDFMGVYWKDQHGDDEQFWEHEWGKHGTCISTLEPRCSAIPYVPQSEVVAFFNRTVQLFKSLPTYSWLSEDGIIPSSSKTYRLDQLQAVAHHRFGHEAVWNCRGQTLNEVWWHFNTKGTVADGTFVPADPVGPRSTCPSYGIKYLPKTRGGDGGGGGGDGGHRPSRPHDPSHPRDHFIHVINANGEREGCLIGSGNWYTRGTCASFSISIRSGSEGLEIRSRKGPCAFSDDGFKCAKGLHSEGFSLNDQFLVHEGQQMFYAPDVPDGQTQVHIIKSKAKHSVRMQIASSH